MRISVLFGEDKNILALVGTEARSFGRPRTSQ